jgi:hypothetical protein
MIWPPQLLLIHRTGRHPTVFIRVCAVLTAPHINSRHPSMRAAIDIGVGTL